MSVQTQQADGESTSQPSRSLPTLRVVRTPAPDPVAPRPVGARAVTAAPATRRGRGAASAGTAGRHARRSGRAAASLAEVQVGISVLQLADQALGEVSVLLRRLRALAVRAAGREAAGREDLQRQAFGVVEQIAMITREVRFDGAAIFDGSLAGREITLPGGGRACVDVAPMNARALGIESPWGRATTSRETRDAELTSSTGTLPSGTFRVVEGQVFGDSGEQVATYDGAVVDFGDGVSATFDAILYFQDGTSRPRSGVFLLDSVLSLRTASAAEHAVSVVDRAAEIVTEQRLLLGWSRSQLTQAAADVLAQRTTSFEALDAALAADGARGLARVIVDNGGTALAAHCGTAHGATRATRTR